MGEFLEIVFAFPTAFYTVLLGVVVGYWLLSATGLVGVDVADGLFGAGDGHFHADGHAHAAGHGVEAGHQPSIFDPLMRLGLGGIPVTVVISVLVASAWTLSFLGDKYLLRLLPDGSLRLAAGLGIIVAAFVVSIPVAALALRPLRKLLARMRPEPPRPLLGQTAVVRSPVNRGTGTAALEDGGAGLILQVREDSGAGFKHGDKVVLIEYLADQNAYRVVSEDEFRGA